MSGNEPWALREPRDGVENALRAVNEWAIPSAEGAEVGGPVWTGYMVAAQMQATCALVHAVRELTEEVRKFRKTE